MALLARILLPMLKFISALIKACAIIVIVFVSVIGLFRLCVIVGLHARGYSDGALYSAGKECVVNTIGVDKINEEVKKVFAESDRKMLSESHLYLPPEDSRLYKVSRKLPSPGTWERTLYCGHNALVLRFGCHYNYVWLVIVDPACRVCDNDKNVKHIADNIVVCFDRKALGR